MKAIQPISRALCLVAVSLVVAACSTSGGIGSNGQRLSPAEAAAQAEATAHYAKATQLYMQAAAGATGPGAQRNYRLQAGLSAAQGGDVQSAGQILDSIEPGSLNATDRALYGLARREISIADLPPDQALRRLPPPNPGTYPSVAQRVWEKRAQLFSAANQPVESVQALTMRSGELRDPQAIRANDNRTYDRSLDAIGLGLGPRSLAAVNAGQTTQGWLALANIGARGYPNIDQRNQALAQWQNQYPGHPANRSVLADRFNYDAGTATLPVGSNGPASGPAARPPSRQIGLALPLTGQFQNAAQAIRDGFMFAYNNKNDGLPKPQIYDSNTMAAQQLLARAQQDNIGVLVGPLDKSKVSAMAGLQSNIPEIGLNYVDSPVSRSGFYQFALSPEDEARAAARRAHDMGYSTALALVPQGSWGDRVLDAFRKQFNAQGGQLSNHATYNGDGHDHSQAIQSVLSGSQADFIFVAAQPIQARLIRSQLKYYGAMNLPMITTSLAYTGQVDRDKDIDLDNVHFVDMPWILGNGPTITALRSAAQQQYGVEASAFARLFAMGMDAWLLTRKIEEQGLQSGDTFEGMTGFLAVEPDNRIQRYMAWAVFHNGAPQLLQMPTRSDVQADMANPAAPPSMTTPISPAGNQPDRGYIQPGPSTQPNNQSNSSGENH
ncbi:MAG: penicillin-binding protein activator [Salinisphaera sp.]|jgi:outer membrane PBP1 activator LpoA protein|nr:penicillin-binding protein activator [Salinisphaera sp.]